MPKKKKNEENGTKYILYTLGVFVVLLIVCIVVVLLKPEKDGEEVKANSIFVSVGNNDLIENDFQVFETYDELVKVFNTDKVSKELFDNGKIVILKVLYDECSERNIEITEYEVNNNILNVKADYEGSCGVCAPNYLYYALSVSKDASINDVKVDYHRTNELHCDPNVAYKPIIYIYPNEKTEVSIKLSNPNFLTVTYPVYNNGWNVIAYPNGKLIDKKTNRELYGLYWEGNNYNAELTEEGFVVKGEDTISFLEEKLAILGLSEREADEFIIYWLPKLQDNKYNYIRFESMEVLNDYMSLEITPTPETLIRVLMVYKPLNEEIEVKAQELKQTERKGYTVVEWGGSLIG